MAPGSGSLTGLTTTPATAGVATDTVTGNLAGSVTLRAAATLTGVAELIRARADSLAVERFCARWAEVGLYRV